MRTTASIYRRADAFYIQTNSLAGTGGPWFADGGLERAPLDASDATLGAMVNQAFGRSRHRVELPDPAMRRQRLESVAKTAGCRTWGQFTWRAHLVFADLDDASITVGPTRRHGAPGRVGFEGIGNKAVLASPTDEELGHAIRVAFDQSQP